MRTCSEINKINIKTYISKLYHWIHQNTCDFKTTPFFDEMLSTFFLETQMESLSFWLGSVTMALGVALIKQPEAHSGFTWPLICCSDRERLLPNQRLFTLSSSKHQGKWYNWSENLNSVWKLCWNIYRLYLDYLIIYLFWTCLWVMPAIPPSCCGFLCVETCVNLCYKCVRIYVSQSIVFSNVHKTTTLLCLSMFAQPPCTFAMFSSH